MKRITVTGIWNEKPLPGLKTCWPNQVAHLVSSRDTRVLGIGSHRTDWLLSVSGPFCTWPKPSSLMAVSHAAERMGSTLSNKLALPVRIYRRAQSIWLRVDLSAEEQARIFIKHYEHEVNER